MSRLRLVTPADATRAVENATPWYLRPPRWWRTVPLPRRRPVTHGRPYELHDAMRAIRDRLLKVEPGTNCPVCDIHVTTIVHHMHGIGCDPERCTECDRPCICVARRRREAARNG